MTALAWLWLAVLVVFLIIEGATAQLVTIWFCGGALAALIAELFRAPLWTEICIFVVVSAILLVATRPLVKKRLNSEVQPTNADRYIGRQAIVTKEIDNTAGTGEVKTEGAVWSARSADGTVIPEGTTVYVSDIKGVKLIVEVK